MTHETDICEGCRHYQFEANAQHWCDFDNKCKHSPNLESMYEKPQLKKIDMQVCIESGVDCEFINLSGKWWIDNLCDIREDRAACYESAKFYTSQRCRVRESHWIYNEWDKCPIPEGLEVILKFHSGNTDATNQYMSQYNWDRSIDGIQVIAFKVIGIADGYEY